MIPLFSVGEPICSGCHTLSDLYRAKRLDPPKENENEKNKNGWNENLPQLIRAVPVEADANVDGDDGEDDAKQNQRGSLADGFDTDEHHYAHDGQ